MFVERPAFIEYDAYCTVSPLGETQEGEAVPPLD